MRKFIITYAPIVKYGNPVIGNTKISVSKPTGDIGHDVKAALNIFIASNGGLEKNEVFSIQEIDDNGKSIGEPILPTGDTSIIPTKK